MLLSHLYADILPRQSPSHIFCCTKSPNFTFALVLHIRALFHHYDYSRLIRYCRRASQTRTLHRTYHPSTLCSPHSHPLHPQRWREAIRIALRGLRHRLILTRLLNTNRMAAVNGLNGESPNGVDLPSHTNGVNGTKDMNGYPSSFAAKHNLAAHFIGSNNLSTASPSKVRNFVQAYDGHTVIKNVSRLLSKSVKKLRADFESIGPHCQQWYCCSQDDQIREEMGIRDLRRRARSTVHSHGHPRGPTSQCRLHPNGRPIR